MNIDVRFYRIGLSAFYGIAGVAHVAAPDPFVMIVPEIIPFKMEIVLITGLLELAGAIGLWIGPLRRAAGLGLAVYALAVWPANLRHALLDLPIFGFDPGWWYHGPRLAAQPLLVWWALAVSAQLNAPPPAQPPP